MSDSIADAMPQQSSDPDRNYLTSVALKKVGWATAKLLAAKVTAAVATPAVTMSLAALGLDAGKYTPALPVIFFGVLVAFHDAVRVKTGWKWL